MSDNNKTARIVGFLFLAVLMVYLTGALLLESFLSVPDYLTVISANENLVIIGAFFEILSGILYVGIALLMYSILKQYNKGLALGYIAFRLIEFAFQILSDLSVLKLLSLSKEFVNAGVADTSYYNILGESLLSERYWSTQISSIAFALCALLLYFAAYHLKFIPRFISVWGLIAASLVLISTLVGILGIEIGTIFEFLTGVPMLLNEVFLGIWLIVKGFNPSISVSKI